LHVRRKVFILGIHPPKMTCRLIIICTIIGFTGLTCSKEKDSLDIVYGKTYLKNDIQIVGDIHVYDRNGEVKGPYVVGLYDDQINNEVDNLRNNFLINQYLDSLNFRTNSEATLSHWGIRHTYDVTSDGDFRILTDKKESEFVCYNNVCSEEFFQRIRKYANAFSSEELVSSVAGAYRFSGKTREKQVFAIADNRLTLSIYAYVIDGVLGFSYNGSLYHELKNDFYKELKPDQQFAIQLLKVTYK